MEISNDAVQRQKVISQRRDRQDKRDPIDSMQQHSVAPNPHCMTKTKAAKSRSSRRNLTIQVVFSAQMPHFFDRLPQPKPRISRGHQTISYTLSLVAHRCSIFFQSLSSARSDQGNSRENQHDTRPTRRTHLLAQNILGAQRADNIAQR